MTPRLFIVPGWVHYAVYCGVALGALWRGRWRERLVAAAFLLPTPLYILFPIDFHSPRHVVFGVRAVVDDLILLAVCLIGLRGARRYWIVWASAFALVEVANDAFFAIVPSVTLYAFASANIIWSWGVVAALLWAYLTNRREPLDPPLTRSAAR